MDRDAGVATRILFKFAEFALWFGGCDLSHFGVDSAKFYSP